MNLVTTTRRALYIAAVCLPMHAVDARSLDAQAPPPLARANRMFFQGKYDSAVLVLRDVVAKDSTNGRAWGLLGASLQGAKKFDEALVVDRRAAQFPNARPTALYNIGLLFGALGNPDSAFAYLNQAKATGRVNLADLDVDNDAAPLRNDPRYAALKPSMEEFSHPFVEPSRILGEWHGTQVNDQFGWIARDIGDVDGDKVHDFVTSAIGHTIDGKNVGAVYVFSSKTGKELWHKLGSDNDALGMGIEAAGDVNRDGIPDVIASSPNISKAYLYSGRDGTLLRTLSGESANDAFGTHVGGVGDANHDGYADVIVGAPGGNGGTGRAYVFSGKDGSPLVTLNGTTAGERFGAAVSGWSDAKRTIIIVGAPGAGEKQHGETFIYRSLTATPAFTLDADSTGGALSGMFVSVPGDFDGDGTPDVFSSDWQNSAHGPATGRTYVVSGATGKTLLTLTGESAGDGFGTSASVAGDVDHDGRADLVIGAWQHASNALSGGKIYLYSGKTGALLRTWTGQVPGETLGFDAVGIGDVNGDGAVDFLLTSAYSAIAGSHSGRVFIVAGDKSYTDRRK